VTCGCHGGLDDEDIASRLYRQGSELLGVGGRAGDRNPGAFGLHLAHAFANQVELDRLRVSVLQQLGDLGLIGSCKLHEQRGRVFVAGVDTLQVQNSKAAEAAYLPCEARVYHRVQRRGEDRHGKGVISDTERDVCELWVNRVGAGYDSDLIEPVGVGHRLCRCGITGFWLSTDFERIHASAHPLLI
jgi:hypothetical protein